jgi:3',5'-cyclic AMP phosphodiesterase CpdA
MAPEAVLLKIVYFVKTICLNERLVEWGVKKILIGLGIVLIVLGFWYLSVSRKSDPPAGGLKVESPKIETRIEPKREILKFSVMSDVHNDTEMLEKAIDMGDGDLVIVTGDLTNDGTRAEQEAIKNVLNENVYVVPGNHDIYKNVWIFGKKYQSFEKSGWKFILIDNSNWRGLGDDQKSWIEDEVSECLIKYCLAFMHKPLAHNFSTHIMGENSQKVTGEAEWLMELLVSSGVKMGYSGHLHYASSYTINNWQTVLVGAISAARNTQTPRFTEVVVYDDGSIENNVKLVP